MRIFAQTQDIFIFRQIAISRFISFVFCSTPPPDGDVLYLFCMYSHVLETANMVYPQMCVL